MINFEGRRIGNRGADNFFTRIFGKMYILKFLSTSSKKHSPACK